MASRFSNTTTVLSTTDSNAVNSTLMTFSPVIDTSQAICGSLYLRAKLTTGSASQKYDVYALYSEDGTNFDDANTGSAKQLGTINLINETGVYRYYSLPLDGLAVAAKYMKIAALPGSASAGTIEANSAKVVIRSPK